MMTYILLITCQGRTGKAGNLTFRSRRALLIVMLRIDFFIFPKRVIVMVATLHYISGYCSYVLVVINLKLAIVMIRTKERARI